MNMNAIQTSFISPASISPAQLCILLAAGKPVELLDVRTPPEFASALPAQSSSPDELNVKEYLEHHTPGQPVYVLCQAGGRARKAIEQFETCGCFDGVLVEGGTQVWIDAGLPVNRGTSNVLPLMRQVQIVVGTLSALGGVLALVMSPWFALLPVLLGCGLLFAGLSGMCGMASLLARMPWNRQAGNINPCFIPEKQ